MTSVFAQNTFDDQLRTARSFVEQKAYAQALQIYVRIESQLRQDPGLLIEWARVYTYADDHAQAIKLFEELRATYPERSEEILRELGDQYLWSGQIPKAIAVYKEALLSPESDLKVFLRLAQTLLSNDQNVDALKTYDAALKRWPNSKDVILAKANALSLLDRLEESYALYQKVLDQNADDLTSLTGQAKVLVWQGYLRRGISRYEDILKKYPKNPDAIDGLAFALHWQGEDSAAAKRFEELLAFEPDRQEAQKMYTKIKGAPGSFIKAYGRFTNDSTPQTVFTNGARVGTHLNDSTSVEGIYEHQILRKKNAQYSTISANREGVGISQHFGLDHELNVFVHQTHFNKINFDPFTMNTWFTYKPDDLWRFDAAYERETFEDNDALFHKIITNSGSLSVDFRPNRFWLFGTKYKRGYYSDHNDQDQVFSNAEYRLMQKPFIKIFFNDYYSDWGEPELRHGYFNPRTLRSDTLGLYSGIDVTNKLFVEAKAAGGYEFQKKSDTQHKISNHPLCYGWLSINYRATDSWLLTASTDYFTTWPDHDQRSYQKRGAYLSVTYNFGANHVGLKEAGRPSRSAGAEFGSP
ncbi:MAG: tetratricopeptide repeat protein [Candidatus Omnitrophica bacterium]|nr:tetratricopeptide repeat protein [Candidatus Omnitrophota bacterium]